MRNKGIGCPYCTSRKLLQGFNDLATKNPKLAKEWNYKRNGNITPSDIFPNSIKKYWWICSKGHEWEATAVGRNNGNNCPYCATRYYGIKK